MKIFVSSPIKGMEDKRKIMETEINRMGFTPFLSESDRSKNLSSLEKCFKEIENCELFILLLGIRYGFIPEGYNISVTELEYDKAMENNIDIIVFKFQYFDQEHRQKKFIEKVGNFNRGRFWGKEIENNEELKNKVIGDIFQYLVDKKEEANKYVPTLNKDEDFIEVKSGKQSEAFILNSHSNRDLLFLKARINYSQEAGSQALMKIKVNDKYLQAMDLINKPLIKKLIDGREFSWFNIENNSWESCYSPNFKDNYYHPVFKIVNGDPYIFIFDLSRIEKKEGNKYEVIIEHNGLKGNEAFKNSIIVKDTSIY